MKLPPFGWTLNDHLKEVDPARHRALEASGKLQSFLKKRAAATVKHLIALIDEQKMDRIEARMTAIKEMLEGVEPKELSQQELEAQAPTTAESTYLQSVRLRDGTWVSREEYKQISLEEMVRQLKAARREEEDLQREK